MNGTAPSGRRAVVVDDNEDMAELIASVLDLAKVDVSVVATLTRPNDTMDAVRRLHPDVVVLDFMMPGSDGLEVAADILAEVPEQDIILFSAYLDGPIIAAAEQLGVRSCLGKDRLLELPDVVYGVNQRAVVVIEGEYDLTNVEQLRNLLRPVRAGEALADLGRVGFLDLKAIEELDRCPPDSLRHIPPIVARVLRLLHGDGA
jgi:CheY-like chemotaxis protein